VFNVQKPAREVNMTYTAAYLIIILSPMVYLLLVLNIRYTIIYDVLRKKHSDTYLKKHMGGFWGKVYFRHFKTEISLPLYYANWFVTIFTASSVLISSVCLLVCVFGSSTQLKMIAHWYLKADVLFVLALTIKQIYDKLAKK
jgi:hypothetical protein